MIADSLDSSETIIDNGEARCVKFHFYLAEQFSFFVMLLKYCYCSAIEYYYGNIKQIRKDGGDECQIEVE